MNKIAVDLIGAFNSPIGDTILIGELVTLFLRNAVFIAGFLFVFLIVLGGIGIIRGAGSGNAEDTQKGKKAITAAVIGFIVIFSAYWIIQIVEAMTDVQILSPGI